MLTDIFLITLTGLTRGLVSGASRPFEIGLVVLTTQ